MRFYIVMVTDLGGVHFVDRNNELTHTERESKQSVLAGLAILGDTSLELTSASGNDKNGAVGLRGTSNHVFDEVTMPWGINDLSNMIHLFASSIRATYRDDEFGGFELPQGNVNGDTTLTLGL